MPRTYEQTGLVRAQAKWVRTSSRKARVVLEHIRGLSVPDAKAILELSTRAAARDIELVLRSAAHNAEANHGLDSDTLVVQECFADEGVTIKRVKPRARGRAMPIRKRTTHITILLRPGAGAPAERTPEPAPVAVAEPVAAEPAKPKRRRAAKPKAEAATTAVAETAHAEDPAEGADEATADAPPGETPHTEEPAEGAEVGAEDDSKSLGEDA
jgi:large subunit ribosomal protein L22